MSTTSDLQPRLAPPGAGIPTFERLIGGTLLKLRRRFGTPDRFSAQFDRERRAIAALCAGRNHITLSARVLIPRLRGLEDSSRFWSVLMTLDHLRIVNESIAGVIGDLTNGRVPEGKASTAAVKPSEQTRSDVIPAYEAACDRVGSIGRSGAELRTNLRYAHPWFGPLDAAGWHAMAAAHMAIHRAQIERILQGALRSDN